MEDRKKLLQKEAKQTFSKKFDQKPVEQKTKPAPKPQQKVKPKQKTKPKDIKKKKGLFERIGLRREKIRLTKDEEDQVQKIMIVLKGKTSEYSREEMKEAMHNLGYKEKIIEEAIRRLYG